MKQYKNANLVYIYKMLAFLWSYVFNMTIVPMFFVITSPFHSIRWSQYTEYYLFTHMGIKLKLTCDEPLIESGFIIANHRSFMDFTLDSFLSKAAVVGRWMAIVVNFWYALFGHMEHRIIGFSRGKEKRHELFQRIKKHFALRSRILFFPEGTRCRYTHLASKEDVKTHLKYGLLKEIYYDKTYPVQIQISNNKEVALDEKKLRINHGTHINTHRTKSIHPKDYNSETDFYDAIAVEWYNAWKITHLNP